MKLLKEDIRVKEVLIEYTWRKIKGRVYYYYRIQGQLKWTRQLTSYKEIPIVQLNWGNFT